jgi:hypothetical protein
MAERVPKGTKVHLVVAAPGSGQPEVVPVPDVTGLQAEKAKTNLQMLDLQVTVEEVSDNAPVGQVIKQSIQPGIRVAKGQTVTLTVSKGPETQPTEPAQPTEPTVPEKAGGGTTDTGTDAEPQVDIQQDTAYAAEHPGQKKFDVTVLVRGRKPGQSIEILMSDKNGKDTVVHSGRHDPGKVVQESVYSVGEPTIEVHWEGNMIERYPS